MKKIKTISGFNEGKTKTITFQHHLRPVGSEMKLWVQRIMGKMVGGCSLVEFIYVSSS